MLITEISRKATYSREAISITRVLDVEPYSEHGLVASALLGGVRFVGNRIVRTLPFRDPHISWAFCKSVEAEGLGKFVGSAGSNDYSILRVWNNGYDKARLTVTYETTEQTEDEMTNSEGPATTDQQENDLATVSYDISAQQLTLPTSRFQWADSPTISTATSGAAGTKTLPKMDAIVTRNFVVNRPLNAITALVGTVNRYPFWVAGVTYAPEMLRFDGATMSQKITNQGAKFHEVQLKFAIQTIWDSFSISKEDVKDDVITTPSRTGYGFVGWNRLFRPDRGYWDRPVLNTDPTRQIYTYDDAIVQGGVAGFRLLFHPLAN